MPFKQFLSGEKTEHRAALPSSVKCLSTIRFKLPITLGMHSLIVVFLKERLKEVELAKVTQALHGRTDFQLVCLMSKAFLPSTVPAFSNSK